MKKKTIFFLVIVFVLTACMSAAGYTVYSAYLRYYEVSLTPAENTVTADHLNNPYIGWYHIYGQLLSETDSLDEDAILELLSQSEEITLIEVNLRNYQETPIGENGLAQLDTLFSYWQTAGKQIILRFLYDWNGAATKTEPKKISTILNHMDQVAPIVNKYKNNIYLMQGTFIGAVGEMHSSNYANTKSMKKLIKHLAEVIDPSIFLSVRTPAMWRTINQTFQPLKKENAFQGTLLSRLGLFNDGMLGSNTDLGTYGSTSLSKATTYTVQGTLKDELSFQNKLCRYVPNGGEVVLNHSRSNFTNALSSLGTMQISYLNCEYDTTVLDKWRAATYTGTGCFQGTDGFTYMEDHLGYRYAINSMSCSFNWRKDDAARLSIKLQNDGFSGSYRKFDSNLTLVNSETGTVYNIPMDFDNRYLTGNNKMTISVKLPIRYYEMGTYSVYYSMTDSSLNRNIYLANSYQQSDEYGYLIGTLSIQKDS